MDLKRILNESEKQSNENNEGTIRTVREVAKHALLRDDSASTKSRKNDR